MAVGQFISFVGVAGKSKLRIDNSTNGRFAVLVFILDIQIRDWFTNYGEEGLQNGRGGGACEVLPLQKREGGKSFSHAEGGGGTKSFGVVFMQQEF